jgi:hypothetical protein
MQNKDDQIAHRTILPRSRHAQRMLNNFGIRHAQVSYYVSPQVSQPLSQLFRIGLGIKTATATRVIERKHVHSGELSLINNVKTNSSRACWRGAALLPTAAASVCENADPVLVALHCSSSHASR